MMVVVQIMDTERPHKMVQITDTDKVLDFPTASHLRVLGRRNREKALLSLWFDVVSGEPEWGKA